MLMIRFIIKQKYEREKKYNKIFKIFLRIFFFLFDSHLIIIFKGKKKRDDESVIIRNTYLGIFHQKRKTKK